MNRFKNYGLWLSIFSLIGLLLGNYGLYEVIGLSSDTYKALVDSLLSIFVMAGVISNPNSGQGYIDKE